MSISSRGGTADLGGELGKQDVLTPKALRHAFAKSSKLHQGVNFTITSFSHAYAAIAATDDRYHHAANVS